MSSDSLLILSTLFSQFWRFFTQWYLPGTNVTPAGMFFLFLIVPLTFKLVSRLIDFNVGLSLSNSIRGIGRHSRSSTGGKSNG